MKTITNPKWIRLKVEIPHTNLSYEIDIEPAVHLYKTAFENIKIPKGLRLPTFIEAVEMDNKISKELNLKSWNNYFWIEQPLITNKNNNYAAGFWAGSVGSLLFCYVAPSGSDAELGVLFVKDVKKERRQKMKTMKIPEMNIEICKEVLHKGKCWNKIQKLIPEGFKICIYQILQDLRNNDKYRDDLGLNHTWEFVQNPDKIAEKNGYAASFGADSDGSFLGCLEAPSGSDAGLGVRFYREIEGVLKSTQSCDGNRAQNG